MAIPSKTNSAGPSRNQLIVSALCKRLNLDPTSFQDGISTKDIKDLSSQIIKSSPNGNNLETNSEVTRWIDFAEKFPADSGDLLKALNELNENLSPKSVLVGEGLTPTEADIIVFSAIHSSVKNLSSSDRKSLPHLMRWIDYIQNKEFGEIVDHILVEKDNFDPPPRKVTEKVEADPNVKKTVEGKKDANSLETVSVPAKNTDAVKVKKESQTATDKKKLPEKVADEKSNEVSVSLLKLQVGLIRKAWKHPSADSLLVEEIDTGDAKLRQVVSGLAKYCSPDELTNRLVVLITNVKPGKLRDVMSEGLVLCASNEDHTVVEPLIPPEGSKVGECISFVGYEGKPEDVLNPKKKQLEKITPHLFTDEKGVATFKGVPFMTSAGPCTSSIPKASIK